MRTLARHAVAWLTAAALTSSAGIAVASPDPQTGKDDKKQDASVVGTVDKFAQELGLSVGGDTAGRLAALPTEAAAPVAQLLSAMLDCQIITDSIGTDQIVRLTQADSYGVLSQGAAQGTRLSECGQRLDVEASSAKAALESVARLGIPMGPIDLWPVLRFEPGSQSNTYLNDYALTIDFGGNDRYYNNSGGNLLDVIHGPAGSASPGPAVGCQNIPDLAMGKCLASEAVLIDLGGDDIYGRFETPDEDLNFTGLDGTTQSCTTSSLVRRIFTSGAAVAGVGLLLDASGRDVYTGKTMSLGTGHLGGTGILRDYGSSDDSYLAMRSSEGAGIVGSSLGLLWDEGGNDRYGYYMPAGDATRPGGVISDKSVCDAVARNVQGAGVLGGTGILEDLSGNDSYSTPAQSQGYGTLGGTGLFWDCQGKDRYSSGAQNGTFSIPTTDSSGFFIDQS